MIIAFFGLPAGATVEQVMTAMLHWQDNSTASIARKLRVSDVSARRWLKEWKE